MTISVLVAAVSLLIAVLDRRRNERMAEVRSWQQAIIQKVFQSDSDTVLTLEEIARRYRSEAVAFSKHRIQPDELSLETLRLVLIELVHRGIVAQLGNDNYTMWGPRSQDREGSAMSAALALMNPMLAELQQKGEEERIKRAVFVLVGDEPHRLTILDLCNKVAKELGVPFDVAKSKVHELLADRKLMIDRSNTVGISPGASIAQVESE